LNDLGPKRLTFMTLADVGAEIIKEKTVA